MTGRVAGKVGLVTGGASGLGAATATLLVAEGADGLGPTAACVHCDVSSEDDIAGAVDAAVQQFGRLDLMFNNAGIVGAVGPIDSLLMDEYEFTMAVLLRSVVLGMKHAARVMKPQHSGVIV